MNSAHVELAAEAFEAFSLEAGAQPETTLRAGEALDEYREPPSFDATLDLVTDDYLERFLYGISYVDAASWRHYLPHFIKYALRHVEAGSDVVDALLGTLRPPDRDPPRLASLTPKQEAVVARVLDLLAFAPESAHQELACQVLEEWWAPGALDRKAAK